MIAIILGVAAAIGPLLLISAKLITAFQLVKGAWVALNATFLISPWGLVIAGVIAVVVLIIANWQKVKHIVIGIWNAIVRAAGPFVKGIMGVIRPVIKAIAAVWRTTWGIVRSVFQIHWKVITTVVRGAMSVMRAVIVPAVKVIAGIWRTVWGGMKTVFSGVWNALLGIARPVLNAIITIVNAVIGAVNTLIRGFNLIPFHDDVPLLPTIPHLARGGRITSAGIALVGERGPELVALSAGASVSPLSDRGGGGRVAISVHLDRRRFGRAIEHEILTRGA